MFAGDLLFPIEIECAYRRVDELNHYIISVVLIFGVDDLG